MNTNPKAMNMTTNVSSIRRSMKRVGLLALVVVAAATVGCRRGQANDALPDEDTFYLPEPKEEGGNTQALCASDSAAYDALLERIATYNEALQARIELLRAVVKATARELERDGEAEYTVERNGVTLVLSAVEAEDGSVSYVATTTGPEGDTLRLLEGSANADRSAGSWTVLRAANERAVVVSWTNVDEVLTVTRTATGGFGERASLYVRTPAAVDVTFSGPNHDGEAQWDRETKDGSIVVDGSELCWDASDDLTDFCSIPCP